MLRDGMADKERRISNKGDLSRSTDRRDGTAASKGGICPPVDSVLLLKSSYLLRGGRLRRRQDYGGCGLFKHFHDEAPLLHLLHESCVRGIADNTGKLCPVVSHDAGAVNDYVVDEPITGLFR